MIDTLERDLREVNEALLISSVHQHELTELAERAQEALRESNARFERLFDASPVGMYLVDAELRIRLASQKALAAFGNIEELIGRDFVDVIHILWPRDSADAIVAHFRHTLATGEPYVSPEFTAERLDRAQREYYDWEIQRIALPDGHYGVVCYFIDISARVIAQQHLRRSDLRYRRLFESAKDGILILNVDSGRIDDANVYLSELLGFSHDEFLHKELWEIGLFGDKEASDVALRELREQGQIYYEYLPLQTKQGKLVDVEVVANVYTDDEHSSIQCNIRDITQRRKTERALEKALVYADDIIATLREPFVVLDCNLRVRTANPAFYDTFQVAKNETENAFVCDLGNGQWNIPELRTLLDRVLSHSQSVQDYEVEHIFPTLGRKTMLLNARPFPPSSQHPELILLAVQDVSALRERAEALAELHRRKDEFLAMLGHELRNPLAPISNAMDLLRLQKNETPLQRQAGEVIQRQLGQLTHLIDELLEISRITTGRIHLHKELLSLRDIVEHATETVSPILEQRHHQLERSLPPQPIHLLADAARLEQVLVNLLTNAAKYTEPGGKIWLSIQREANTAVIRVRDTGVGIEPELLPHIFDLFMQADRSLDRSQGGLGIGLSLVQRLVEMHDGSVEARSTLGEGSEFIVRLPLAPMAAPQASRSAARVAPQGTSLRVLVVDDRRDASQMLATLLKAAGYDTQMAEDGPTALKIASTFLPQVVLLDIGLPGMSGYEVAQHIRQQPALAGVVLVAVTGYGQESDRQKSREAGFDHHLVKPASFRQVRELLASVSQKQSKTNSA